MKRLACLAGLVLGACGVPETGDPPPVDEMYFPVGLAPHPDGRWLYVANAGFDRRYNAGTIQVFDTFTRRVLPTATVRTGLFAGELVVARFSQPYIQADAAGSVTGATGRFDVTVTNEGGDAEEVGVLARVYGTATAGSGSEGVQASLRGGEIRFRIPTLAAGESAQLEGEFACDGDCPAGADQIGLSLSVGGLAYETPAGDPVEGTRVAALVPTREDDTLTWLEVHAEKGDAAGHLRCNTDDGRDCDEEFQYTELGQISTTPAVGASPYGIALDRTGFYLSHVKRGELSRWRLDADAAGFRPAGVCRLGLSGGASTVARHPLLGWAYVSDRFGQALTTVATLDPLDRGLSGRISAEKCRLEERSPLVVDPDPGEGRTRGLAFSADGTLLYVSTGSDSSLHVYDTSIAANGRPRQLLLEAIPLGFGPNVVRVAGLRPGERRALNGPDLGAVGRVVDERGEGLVYVTAFDADQLLVIDPTLMAVIAQIPTGTGPHDVTFLPDADGRLQAWVGNFRDHSLTVVDIDPDSPRRFTALANLK